jgi:hypothetical protein
MRVQDAMCRYTEGAVDLLYRFARRVPEDKLTWVPMDAGRSVLDQLQECAQAPIWYIPMLDPTFSHGYTDFTEMGKARREWTTIDECERVTRENTEKLLAAIRAVPDEQLDEEVKMPWGETMKKVDVIGFHHWNLTYHLGQIAYVQTLYGDKEMV